MKNLKKILLNSLLSFLLLSSCNSISDEKVETSDFIYQIFEIFEDAYPEIKKPNYVVNVDISHNEDEISIFITAFEKWLFPNIDSCYLGFIETEQNFYVFSGYPDSTLLTKMSNTNKCKFSQNTEIDFEYDPIWWEIWLFNNYELNEVKTHKTTEYDNIEDIIKIAKLLDIDTSMTIEKNYYDEPIGPIDNPSEYVFGYDSLISYLISKIDVNEFISDSTIKYRLLISCIIDSTGEVDKVEFHNSFENPKIENEIQNALIGLPDFTIPTHRNHKVKSGYTLLLKK